MSLTYTDIFCGAGGSSIGLSAAGMTLKLAANHSQRAIDTHAANFREAEHLVADVSNYDMRRLPRTDVLWASPECTWHSPAGGRKRMRAQLDLLDDYVPDTVGERSRATMFDVIRATEVHGYRAVIVENVLEVAEWTLFDWWLDGMVKLGYHPQVVCVSSAHIGGPGNPHAPQWRDRLYVVFTQEGITPPDVRPRPLAWCDVCEADVAAVQSWKNPRKRKIGKYGQQYVYVCPTPRCHQVIEPYVAPAAAAIDWTNPGQRIGDRKKPLAPNTRQRIQAGLDMFAQPVVAAAGGNTYERPGSGYVRAWPTGEAPLNARTGTPGDGVASPPVMVTVNHGGHDPRAYPAEAAPLPSRTVKIGDGLVVPSGGTWNDSATPLHDPMRTRTTRETDGVCFSPYLVELRNHCTASGIDEPISTITTSRHHWVIQPFVVKNYGGNCQPQHTAKPASDPLSPITTRDHHALVIPYRRGNRTRTTGEPLNTVHTHDSAAVIRPAVDVDDCYFRMLQPREHLNAQRFPDSYIVTGNRSEQTMQAGNAVSANVAQWLGQQLMEVLT